MPKTLHLTLKKKWFDMIDSGEKKEEYRDIKDFFVSRLFEVVKPMNISGFRTNKILDMFNFSKGYKKGSVNAINFLIESGYVKAKEYDYFEFRNGYSKESPIISGVFNGVDIGPAKPEWSDNWQGSVFIIKLGKLLQGGEHG